jgi:hypothetical protein
VAFAIGGVVAVTALLAAPGGHERLDGRRSLGLVLGFGAVMLLLGLSGSAVGLRRLVDLGITMVGDAAGLLIVARRLQDAPAIGVVAISLSPSALGYALPTVLALPSRLAARHSGRL